MFTQEMFTFFAVLVSLLVLFVLYMGNASDNSITRKTNRSSGRTTNVSGQQAKAFQVKKWNASANKKPLSRNYDIKTVVMVNEILNNSK